ncbi:MAG: xanthine dehydrogenase family protein molybdopterin-binding subunit, partial [Dehalococcoidia bacterium]|nr:xanthine dehydrogenase family protein molybdopterin-binding subunit [Dehalococcoidia bacterium]
TGIAQYTGDISLPGMLYGKILRSPYAHARIKSIDKSRAERLPGVKAVITGKDTAGYRFGVFRATRDQYLLPIDKVNFFGEEVAAVAAVDLDTAEEALSLIDVDYEPLPFVLTPEEALREGAPVIHDIFPGNAFRSLVEFGNVEEGFAQSDYIREDTFSTPKVSHCQLEPYGALVNYDSWGKLSIWVPNQSPFTKRRALSNALGIPLNSIRVHHVTIGGAFAGRSDTFPAEFCGALLSMKLKKPVRIVYTREETMFATRHKHSMSIWIKTGVKKDGTIMARDIKAILDGGAYMSSGVMAVNVPWQLEEVVYRSPNMRYEGYRVYTNKTPASMMRTHPSQLHYSEDVQLDMIAKELNLDALEIRLKNAVQPGEKLPSGSKVSSYALSETMIKATEMAGWKQKRGKMGKYRGIGMGCAACMAGFNLGFRGGSSAIIKFNEDGSATLFSGNVDNGQGNESVLTQIAAEELGLTMNDINLICADSEYTTQDPGSYTMTAVFVSGNAVKRAAADARQQLISIAAGMLQVEPGDLAIRQRQVYTVKGAQKRIPVEDVIRMSFLKGEPVIGRGAYILKVDDTDMLSGRVHGQQTGAYTGGTVVAEVEVDGETGSVKVVNLTIVSDCGVAINPMAVEGQQEGVSVMALGETLCEYHTWNKDTGELQTGSFRDYKIPGSLDLGSIKAALVETIDPEGPFGAKEGGVTCGPAVCGAIANAIYDATGIWVKELPVMAEKIYVELSSGIKDETGN